MGDLQVFQVDPDPAQILEEIRAERLRQVTVEGYTRDRDDQYIDGDLAAAAGCYALEAGGGLRDFILDSDTDLVVPNLWPFASDTWKPKGDRRDLIRAGALIVAEIERLDRQPAEPEPPAGPVTPEQAALRLKRAEAAFRGVQDRMADAMCELRDAAMAAGALKTGVPAAGDRVESIFPTFDVHVPLPADTAAPAPEVHEELGREGEGSTS